MNIHLFDAWVIRRNNKKLYTFSLSYTRGWDVGNVNECLREEKKEREKNLHLVFCYFFVNEILATLAYNEVSIPVYCGIQTVNCNFVPTGLQRGY